MNFRNDPFFRFLQGDDVKSCMEQVEGNRPAAPIPQVPPIGGPVGEGCPWPGSQSDCRDNVLAGKSLAMVYSPCQAFEALYEPDEALFRGTVFRQLEKPFMGDRVK